MHSTSILFNVSKSAVAVMTPWSVINGIDPEPYLSNHTVAFWSQILNTGVETRAFLLLEIFPSRAWGERGFEGSFGSCCLHRCQTKLLAGSCCSTFVGFFSPFFVSSELTGPSFTTSLCLVLMILCHESCPVYGAFEPRICACVFCI